MPITGLHAILYSKHADEARRFMADVLGFPSVDAGRGWLIFKAPPAELAIHPAEDDEFHELYFMCDDIEATVAELRAKNVEVTPIVEQRWGRLIEVVMPGGQKIGVYEPKHPKAIDL